MIATWATAVSRRAAMNETTPTVMQAATTQPGRPMAANAAGVPARWRQATKAPIDAPPSRPRQKRTVQVSAPIGRVKSPAVLNTTAAATTMTRPARCRARSSVGARPAGRGSGPRVIPDAPGPGDPAGHDLSEPLRAEPLEAVVD